MRKGLPVLLLIAAAFVLTTGLSPASGPQADPSQKRADLVPVAVRVFDGKMPVTGLKLEDFEILEDGIPRPVEAFYAVDKNILAGPDAGREGLPAFNRKFYLLFQLFEYHPKLADAIRRLFVEVLVPGDSLEIQTPVRNYKLTEAAFANKSKDVLAEEMTDIVKKDILRGSMAYNNLLTDLKRHARAIGGSNAMRGLEMDTETEEVGLEMLLPRYKEILSKMDALRRIDLDKFLVFAQALKAQSGRKSVIFIYQREFRPELSPAVMNELQVAYQDSPHILAGLYEAFTAYTRNISQNTRPLRESFADSEAQFDFVFMNKSPEQMTRIVMREQSEDTFKLFSSVALATGGSTYTSQNPAPGIEAALEASDKYYLLYFSPFQQTKKGAYRSLKIRIKDKDFVVANRQGYIY